VCKCVFVYVLVYKNRTNCFVAAVVVVVVGCGFYGRLLSSVISSFLFAAFQKYFANFCYLLNLLLRSI
jgi:hypothetical protein